MHKTRYNALRLKLRLSPRGPLLIKAGGISADPSLPDMQFVRTFHPEKGEVLYLPGSSLKGVVRGFVEKVLRTVNEENSWRRACPTFPNEPESCARKWGNEESSARIYANSCGACRTFGHTRLKGRAAFTDFMPISEIKTEIRYGVAISRLSHAVGAGPFEMEIAVAGTFEGQVVLENFELWQVGLLALAFESMNMGLVKVGFGKNRGFGEVQVEVAEAILDEVAVNFAVSTWRGLGAFVDARERGRYQLYEPYQIDDLPAPERSETVGFYTRRVYGAETWYQAIHRVMEQTLVPA